MFSPLCLQLRAISCLHTKNNIQSLCDTGKIIIKFENKKEFEQNNGQCFVTVSPNFI